MFSNCFAELKKDVIIQHNIVVDILLISDHLSKQYLFASQFFQYHFSDTSNGTHYTVVWMSFAQIQGRRPSLGYLCILHMHCSTGYTMDAQ